MCDGTLADGPVTCTVNVAATCPAQYSCQLTNVGQAACCRGGTNNGGACPGGLPSNGRQCQMNVPNQCAAGATCLSANSLASTGTCCQGTPVGHHPVHLP